MSWLSHLCFVSNTFFFQPFQIAFVSTDRCPHHSCSRIFLHPRFALRNLILCIKTTCERLLQQITSKNAFCLLNHHKSTSPSRRICHFGTGRHSEWSTQNQEMSIIEYVFNLFPNLNTGRGWLQTDSGYK